MKKQGAIHKLRDRHFSKVWGIPLPVTNNFFPWPFENKWVPPLLHQSISTWMPPTDALLLIQVFKNNPYTWKINVILFKIWLNELIFMLKWCDISRKNNDWNSKKNNFHFLIKNFWSCIILIWFKIIKLNHKTIFIAKNIRLLVSMKIQYHSNGWVPPFRVTAEISGVTARKSMGYPPPGHVVYEWRLKLLVSKKKKKINIYR